MVEAKRCLLLVKHFREYVVIARKKNE